MYKHNRASSRPSQRDSASENLPQPLSVNQITALAVAADNTRKRELVHTVFSSLQALERCLLECRQMLQNGSRFQVNRQQKELYLDLLLDQQRIIHSMRRTANKLQFELASNNWEAAVRHINLFYGMNHLVRPEIQGIYLALTNRSANARTYGPKMPMH